MQGKLRDLKLELDDGWSAKWIRRDNFILTRLGHSYEVYAPLVQPDTRILMIHEMPKTWLPPNDGNFLSDAELQQIACLAEKVVKLNNEYLILE